MKIVISGGFDCFLVKWNISAPQQSKRMNIGKTVFENFDRTVEMCNPPHVYSVLYDSDCTHYLTSLGNGAVCSIKRKTMKISHYEAVHSQRIVDAVLANEASLLITASSDLCLGLSVYDKKTAIIEAKAKIEISESPNAIMFDATKQAIYVADTGNDIKLISIKL